MAKPESPFDASRAELFEALGHPVRVKILQALDYKPMGFADLKKTVGIDSSGHLQFHLGKLSGLISTTSEGDYVLTDDGKEAIRVLGLTSRGAGIGTKSGRRPFSQGNRLKLLVVVLLVALVALSGVVVYQQTKIPGSTHSGVSGLAHPASLCSSNPPPTNQATIGVYHLLPSSVAVI